MKKITVHENDLMFLLWTSRRYCDGRRTGVPNQFNEVYERMTKENPIIKMEDKEDAAVEFFPYAQYGGYDPITNEGDARPGGNCRCLICDAWLPDCKCSPDLKQQVSTVGYLNYSKKNVSREGHETHSACDFILKLFGEKSIGCCCTGHKCKKNKPKLRQTYLCQHGLVLSEGEWCGECVKINIDREWSK